MTLDNELFLYNRQPVFQKFKVVGLIPHKCFQKCRFLVEKLHITFPKEYAPPEIRAMLNLDWDEYLTKMKRRYGKPYYLLQAPVAVYYNGQLLGDDRDLVELIRKTYNLQTNLDFEEMADKELIKYFQNYIDKYKRKFIYLTIAIDEHVIGSMLFMLYNDLVPITCDNFMVRCTDRTKGYRGTKIHRIARYSWIQCGGWSLEHVHMPCENYAVPHNRRGVLSMCNKKRHEDNSTQFYITLEPASWMDYNYVAFGQLLQGAEILNYIEKVATYYESPVRKIEIVNCGEFTLCPVPDEEYAKALNPPYETLFSQEVPVGDVDSVLSLTGYKKGKYFLRTDLRPYMPFARYSQMFDSYLQDIGGQLVPPEYTDDVVVEKELSHVEEEEEVDEDDDDLMNIDLAARLKRRKSRKSTGSVLIDDVRFAVFDKSRTFYHKHIIM